MGKNMVAKGDSVMIAIPDGGCSTGTPILWGAKVGVPDNTYAASTSGNVTLHLAGVFSDLVKKEGDTFAEGAVVYWDDTEKELTSTSSGNTLAGHAYVAAGSSATTMTVRLVG